MQIKRIERSKHKKGRILVFLEDNSCLKITEQELLDFNLQVGEDLEEFRLEELKTAAGTSNARMIAADLIGRRAMSRRDLEYKLQEKGASQSEANYAAEWLESIGAINDAEYAAALVRHCGDLGYGFRRAREKLYEKGIPRELWDDALSELPDASDWIARFLERKLQGKIPDSREKKRLSDALLRRGFSWENVQAAFCRLNTDDISED